MKQKIKWLFLSIIFLFIILIIFKSIFYQYKLPVYDGFETTKLNKIWSTDRMERSSFQIQSKVVRKGNNAAKITLKYGDKVELGNGKDKDSERDELLESSSLYANEDSKYEYQFSMLLPDSFPILPVRLVIAQWKQYCPHCTCTNYSPIIALRYISGKLFITFQTDSVRHILYSTNEEIRGRWLDFRFIIKFSKKDGELKAYLNDKNIIDYTGTTSYAEDCKFLSTKNKYYFKMGLYRDRITNPMTIYIDEYRKIKIN